jgi:tetratricopeptide (TPR) repeat protein
VCHSTFQKANKAYAGGDYSKAQDLYMQLYHPIFFATADYKDSIDKMLAELSLLQGEYDDAAYYYERGLTVMPYSTDLLYSYLKYLHEYDPSSIRIKEIEARLITIQPNLI